MSETRNATFEDLEEGQTVVVLGIDEQHVGEIVPGEMDGFPLAIKDWKGDIVWYCYPGDEYDYTILREKPEVWIKVPQTIFYYALDALKAAEEDDRRSISSLVQSSFAVRTNLQNSHEVIEDEDL